MTVQLAVSLTPFLMEYQHLLTLYQSGYYFADHLGTLNSGNADGHFAVVVHQKDLVKLYRRASLCLMQMLNKQFLASLCLKLLAIDFYNRVHAYVYLS